MKQIIFCIVLAGSLCVGCMHSGLAQGHFEVEVDPSTYILKGYSFHAGYQVGHSRFNVGTYAFELPGIISGTKGFSQKNYALQFKYDYIFGGEKGWYLGAQMDLTRKRITENEVKAAQKLNRIVAGGRIGYRFLFGSEQNGYRGFCKAPQISDSE